MNPFLQRRGHSLIELVVVVAVISLLTGLGVMTMRRQVPRFNAVKAARELQADVMALRNTAVQQGKEARLLLVDADPDWNSASGDSVGEYWLQVGNRSLGSDKWEILPTDATDDGTDDETARGLVQISVGGQDELRGVSLKPWEPISNDAITFSPRGFVSNPATDFGPDGYLTITLVNKAGWADGIEDAISLKIARSGNVRMVSSLTGEELGAAGTGTI